MFSAYFSRRNCGIVEALGAKPFIKLKCHVKGKSPGAFAWRRLVYDFRRGLGEWKRMCCFRSSAEPAFSAFKRSFGYRLLLIRKDLQRKELVVRGSVYNLNIAARLPIQRQSHLNFRLYIRGL